MMMDIYRCRLISASYSKDIEAVNASDAALRFVRDYVFREHDQRYFVETELTTGPDKGEKMKFKVTARMKPQFKVVEV